MIYHLMVGTPVENCDGDNSTVTNQIGGSVTVGETWSAGGTIGFDIGVLKMEANAGWSHTQSVQYQQMITNEIQAGKKVGYIIFAQSIRSKMRDLCQGVLVANIRYKRTSGTVQVGNG
jgi:hypothetical protein